MNHSETVDKIYPALLKAQIAMDSASKDSKNPHFRSNFADFSSVLDACKDKLNEEGVLILQPTLLKQLNGADGSIELVDILETTLIHGASGQFISAEIRIICIDKSNPQKLGSAITYAKRYGLQSLIVLPSEDDDGQSNFTEPKPSRPSAAKPQASSPKPVAKPSPKPAKPKPKL
jgi:hypothetical protein